MLSLTRKLGQQINLYHPDGRLLGRIRLHEIKDYTKVKLALDFPQEITILREEIDAENDPQQQPTV